MEQRKIKVRSLHKELMFQLCMSHSDVVVDSSGLDDNSSGARVSSADPNVSKNSGGTNTDNENATVTHIYEGTFGGEYPEYLSDDSSLSTKEVPMGKNGT